MTVHRSDRPPLQIQDLRTQFLTQDGTVKAVDGVSYEIGDGKTVGVVGESGCGKSITALSVMRLIEQPGRIVGGSVLLRGRDLLRVDDAEMRDIRGNQISMIFQEPMTSLNPVYTCGDQISEAVSLHEAVGRRQAWERARMAIMLITHDLGVIAEMADDVVVMYAGQVVEQSDADTVFAKPHHPYTTGLLASIPRLGEKRQRLEVIQGVVPNPLNLPKGCLFKRRCPHAMPVCDTPPPLQEIARGHLSRCWLTPAGEPPAVGPEATGELAEAAASALQAPA